MRASGTDMRPIRNRAPELTLWEKLAGVYERTDCTRRLDDVQHRRTFLSVPRTDLELVEPNLPPGETWHTFVVSPDGSWRPGAAQRRFRRVQPK